MPTNFNFEKLKFINNYLKKIISNCPYKSYQQRKDYFDNLESSIFNDDIYDWIVDNYVEITEMYVDIEDSIEKQIIDLQVEVEAYIITHS